MIRSDQQLVERMALVFHDWFATSLEAIHLQEWILEQTNLFRRHGLGSFKDLIAGITLDRAMIYWLSSHENLKGRVNENYARELMELFTLGANRGAYTEQDVREAARALSGFKATWADGYPSHFTFTSGRARRRRQVALRQDRALRLDRRMPDGRRASDAPALLCDKALELLHPDAAVGRRTHALEELYVTSGYEIRPVLEAILCSPDLYTGARMVKPPVVYNAGMLRARGRYVTTRGWYWYSSMAGQRLYWPPDVSGWNDKRWLDTNTHARAMEHARQVFLGQTIGDLAQHSYDAAETPCAVVQRALEFWGNPTMSPGDARRAARVRPEVHGLERRQRAAPERPAPAHPCTPDYLTS